MTTRIMFEQVLLLIILSLGIVVEVSAQARVQVDQENLEMNIGQPQTIKAKLMDEKGKTIPDARIFYYSRSNRVASVDTNGLVTAHSPGTTSVLVMASSKGRYVRTNVSVKVNFPPLKEIVFEELPARVYANTQITLAARVLDELGMERTDLNPVFFTTDTTVADIDEFNQLHAYKEGLISVVANVRGISATKAIRIDLNPVRKLQLAATTKTGLTGDVISFEAKALADDGSPIEDIPVTYAFSGKADDVMNFATGTIEQDGRFVAYEAGLYTITASCGSVSAQTNIRIKSRADMIKRRIDFVGHGKVQDKHTSDLWVWEGVDGRDYAVTGTWGADGEAFFWDVTNPQQMAIIDTIQVDARTVNDVKVSEDGRICVISREGASNRKNGIIILDVTNPRNVYQLAEYNDGLTGGVHNLFIYKDHVYALSNAERYDIINIEDPANPYKVGEFELETPGHSIHDVWIEDGLAYSSNWHDGVQIVDVGNGMAGGTPAKPVKVASFNYPSGWNHAAFPFYSKSTGKFYVIAGDEAFPYRGLSDVKAAGWLHVFDCTDLKNPKEVARYEVPGAGSHNFWIEDEVLYVANYNGGLRVVDISGELIGDLYRQGREIGSYLSYDRNGYIPNAPMAWGPQPYKGYIFFSDWNSGLWSVKMEENKLKN